MCAPAFRALDNAAATACFSGCPAARISRMFCDMVARELPGFSGIRLDYIMELLLSSSALESHPGGLIFGIVSAESTWLAR